VDVEVEKKKYMITRMLPPGKIRYFFSNPKKLRAALDHKNRERTRPKNMFIKIKYGIYTCIRWLRFNNFIINEVNKDLIDKKSYKPTVSTKPRTLDDIWI